MARIVSFEPHTLKRPQTHKTHVPCFWSIVDPGDGTRLLQLDTRGSSKREMPGKLSQTVQLDRKSAEQLFAILKREFGFS